MKKTTCTKTKKEWKESNKIKEQTSELGRTYIKKSLKYQAKKIHLAYDGF